MDGTCPAASACRLDAAFIGACTTPQYSISARLLVIVHLPNGLPETVSPPANNRITGFPTKIPGAVCNLGQRRRLAPGLRLRRKPRLGQTAVRGVEARFQFSVASQA
jgi:hypothetical protein